MGVGIEVEQVGTSLRPPDDEVGDVGLDVVLVLVIEVHGVDDADPLAASRLVLGQVDSEPVQVEQYSTVQ